MAIIFLLGGYNSTEFRGFQLNQQINQKSQMETCVSKTKPNVTSSHSVITGEKYQNKQKRNRGKSCQRHQWLFQNVSKQSGSEDMIGRQTCFYLPLLPRCFLKPASTATAFTLLSLCFFPVPPPQPRPLPGSEKNPQPVPVVSSNDDATEGAESGETRSQPQTRSRLLF